MEVGIPEGDTGEWAEEQPPSNITAMTIQRALAFLMGGMYGPLSRTIKGVNEKENSGNHLAGFIIIIYSGIMFYTIDPFFSPIREGCGSEQIPFGAPCKTARSLAVLRFKEKGSSNQLCAVENDYCYSMTTLRRTGLRIQVLRQRR
jgi:hypothetical protein